MAEAGGLVARALQGRSVSGNRSCRAELKGSPESGVQAWGAMGQSGHLAVVVEDQVLRVAPG